ncbi:pinc domain-containing protein [Moniliophthora roreri]|nr:pinc domain-containing protein [Moniliophthora roreri]
MTHTGRESCIRFLHSLAFQGFSFLNLLQQPSGGLSRKPIDLIIAFLLSVSKAGIEHIRLRRERSPSLSISSTN